MVKKYDLIARDLSELISTMSPGEKIPSEQALAQKYSVSTMTVRRALQVLHRAGHIEGVSGRGTFVLDPRMTRPLTSSSFSDTMRLAGRQPSSRLISASIEPATSEELTDLHLSAGSRVLHVRRLRCGDDVPLCVEHAKLSAERFPDLLGFDLEQSLYAVLRTKYGVVIARSQFEVFSRMPDAPTAELLGIDSSVPSLQTVSISRDQYGEVVERTLSIYRGDLYSLRFQPEPMSDNH